MKKFEFNENGVCTNPDIAFDIKTLMPNYKNQFKIYVASNNKGLWSYGHDYNDTHGGSGSDVSFTNRYNRRTFQASKKEAILACIEALISLRTIRGAAITAVKDYRNTLIHEQLQLF